jgi:hypothetical protein
MRIAEVSNLRSPDALCACNRHVDSQSSLVTCRVILATCSKISSLARQRRAIDAIGNSVSDKPTRTQSNRAYSTLACG